jgi:formylglycine-generating enzyme
MFGKKLVRGLMTVAFAMVATAVGNAWGQVQYTVTDLGTLSGGTFSVATGINAMGQVVGESNAAGGHDFAFLYSGGTMKSLGALDGEYSSASGINATGQVAGTTDVAGGEHAFLYNHGTMTDLGVLPGGTVSYGHGINATGQVVGICYTNSSSLAFLYSGGTMENLNNLGSPPPGWTLTDAIAINDNGQIATWGQNPGVTGAHSFLYSGGIFTDVGTLGGDYTEASGMNNAGQVVGVADLPGDTVGRAFLYSSGTIADLGTLAAPYNGSSNASGINSSGQVVGFSIDDNLPNYPQHAFFYSNGTMEDLNSLIPQSSGWTLQEATAINDTGQIVGYGINPSGQQDAFFLTPIPAPEPSILSLLIVGAAGLATCAWRRRGLGQTICMTLVLLSTAGLAQAASVFNMPSGETSLQFVTVGNPGNATDPATGNLYGSVSYSYNMGECDVTLGQYTTFLNAVATTGDPFGLYNIDMQGGNTGFYPFGISQIGSPGSYTYSVTGSNPQAANMPVFCETWGDAARFCNWLDNGQPTAPEGNGTTETGAYQLGGGMSNNALIAIASPPHSGSGAPAYFLPTENEWYKAAYFDPLLNRGLGGYYTYATQSNTAPDNSLSLATSESNDSNYFINNYTDPTNYLTPVGAFSKSPGYYGTYDQSGDIFQWNEAVISGSYRGDRGGSWVFYGKYSSTESSSTRGNDYPADNSFNIGFRVASSAAVPEPGGIALLLTGAAGLLGVAWRRKRAT